MKYSRLIIQVILMKNRSFSENIRKYLIIKKYYVSIISESEEYFLFLEV